MAMQPQMMPGWDFLEDRRTRFVNAFGRLQPGRTLAQASSADPEIKKGLKGSAGNAEATSRT